MPNERFEPRRAPERNFESEPADEWRESYGRGGPVRSDDPERDYFFERNAAPSPQQADHDEERGLRRKNWQAVDGEENAVTRAVPSYRGRGPKNYRPRDERLQEIACEKLTDDPLIDASGMEVTVAAGEVMVAGTVVTPRMKIAAEKLLGEIPGVTRVRSSLLVRGRSD